MSVVCLILPLPPVQKTVNWRAGIGARLLNEYIQCRKAADLKGIGTQPDALCQTLVFELNRSGLYMSMKEELQTCVDAIGKEKFGSRSRDEMIPVCSKIYTYLLDEMHSWIKQVTGQTQVGQTMPADTVSQLVSLASEYEIVGEKEKATRMHEERCTLTRLPCCERMLWDCPTCGTGTSTPHAGY